MYFDRACIAYNVHRLESIKYADRVEHALSELNLSTLRLPLGLIEGSGIADEDLASCDLGIVLGGDGTLLSAARLLAMHGTYLLGINTGHLGFLSEASIPENLRLFLEEILNGDFRLDARTMLYGEIVRGQASTQEEVYHEGVVALNDIVISRSSRSHILRINLDVDGSEIAQYSADGLITCTPTGSTAYALAAGGAVLAPDIKGIGIVPICAHTLTSRPLVISDSSVLKLSVSPRNKRQSLITVQADGQDTFLLEPEDQVIIKKAERSANLIRSYNPSNSFYKVLSQKLLWGKSSS